MLCSIGTCVSTVWVAPYDRLRLTEAIMHLALSCTVEAELSRHRDSRPRLMTGARRHWFIDCRNNIGAGIMKEKRHSPFVRCDKNRFAYWACSRGAQGHGLRFSAR
jgi:hypothetical protein